MVDELSLYVILILNITHSREIFFNEAFVKHY